MVINIVEKWTIKSIIPYDWVYRIQIIIWYNSFGQEWLILWIECVSSFMQIIVCNTVKLEASFKIIINLEDQRNLCYFEFVYSYPFHI